MKGIMALKIVFSKIYFEIIIKPREAAKFVYRISCVESTLVQNTVN